MIRNAASAMLIGFTLVVAAARPASAQDVAGAVEGRIVGTDSQPVIEADIEASSPALQQPAKGQSSPRGTFRILSLPVGTYMVRIRSIGYRPVVYQRVVVGLGRTTSLGVVSLEPQTVQLPEIVVIAAVAPIDLATAASGTNLRADQLDALPINRTMNSIISLAPQANYQAADIAFRSEGVNVAGGSVWDNAYFVDGVNVTDPKRGAVGINLPYNFVQEVQVKTGGYEAEYGRALGGIVNVVTPSGGNEFHGALFTFFTNSALRTEPKYGLIQTHLDQYTQFDLGGSLGGPIRRDRLWFFAAYNPLVDLRNASFPGISPERDRQTQHRFATKLTWQPASATRIVFTATGDPIVHTGVAPILDVGPATGVLNRETVVGYLHQGGIGLSLHLVQVLHSSALLEGTLSRSTYRDDFGPETAIGASQPRFTDSNGVWSGGFGGSDRNRQGRTGIQGSATLPTDSHTLKIGAEYESNTLSDRLDEGTGQRGGFLYYGETGDSMLPWEWDRYYGITNVANRILTTYVQDSWGLTTRLRLNAGLRWEGQWWRGSSGKIVQSISDQFAPRFGLIFSPGRLGSQKIFASGGRFFEQVPLEALGSYYGAGGYSITFYPNDPRVDTSGQSPPFVQPNGTIGRVAGLRGQYYDEVTLGYERGFGSGFKVGMRGVHRVLRSVIEDSQLGDSLRTLGNPGRGALVAFPNPYHHYDALVFTFERTGLSRFQFLGSYVLSRNWGNTPGLFAEDGQPPNGGSQFDTLDSLAISSGLLPNDRTHVIKFFGSYRLGSGLTVGTSAFWQSGTPLNEYGKTAHFYNAFLQPRGTAGRTPATWDLNLRLDYLLPRCALREPGPRILLNVEHIASPSRAIAIAQGHYFGIPTPSNPVSPRSTYGKVVVYQPPMSARLGVMVGF